MYRWNSRVPTVRWKDNFLNDRVTATTIEPVTSLVTTATVEDTVIIDSSKKPNSYSKSNSISASCVGSGGNLSGSALTSTDPITLPKPTTRTTSTSQDIGDYGFPSETLPEFDISLTKSRSNNNLNCSPPLSSASGTRSRESTGNIIHSLTTAATNTKLDSDESKWKLGNVIKTLFSIIGFFVREVLTLVFALLIGLLVNPINYCIYCFSPKSLSALSSTSSPFSSLFSSIQKIGPGGSSSLRARYPFCRRKHRLLCGGDYSSTYTCHNISAPCFCTCNCISFLRPIFDVCCSKGIASYFCKDNSCGSVNSTAGSTHQSRIGGVGKPRRLGKMAQILSKTMTLLGVAFIIHFIIMSTFAEREGFSQQPRYSPEDSKKHHYYQNYYHSRADELMVLNTGKRLARSYRHDKHSEAVDPNVLPPLNGHHSRLPSNKSEAVFSTENSTVIIAQIGSKTYLPCAVRNLGSGVASWIRRRDYHLLTVGMGTYSNDDRFMVSHNRQAQSWELHIKFVKPSDEGIYECQISTHPPSSIFVHLRVVEAKAEILGEPDKHVRSGSTFELVCVLRDSTEPPVYVFWYHNNRMINYDNVRGVQVSSDAEKSILTIQEAQKSDSGNYTCFPSNARASSISLHILNGEKPAAMQHGSRSSSSRHVPSYSTTSLLFVTAFAAYVLTSWLVTTNLSLQKLFHFLSDYQYNDGEDGEEEEQKKKKPQREIQQGWYKHGYFPSKSPPQRKLQMREKEEKNTHHQNRYHHLHLLLLREISEGFANSRLDDDSGGGRGCVGVEMNNIFSASDNNRNTICIKKETKSNVSVTPGLIFILNVSQRRTGEYISKSNLKKPQRTSCTSGSFITWSHHVTITESHGGSFLASDEGIRHRPDKPIEKGTLPMVENCSYEICDLRQVVSRNGKGIEGNIPTDAEDQGKTTFPNLITEVDRYHKQNHTHTFLVSTNGNGSFENRRVISMMAPYFSSPKWNPDKCMQVNNAFRPEIRENILRKNISKRLDFLSGTRKVKKICTIAPGVAIQSSEKCRENTMTILTSFPAQISASSLSLATTAFHTFMTTFPTKASRRFIIETDDTNRISSFRNDHDYYNVDIVRNSKAVVLRKNSSLEMFPEVQVIIVVVVIGKEEVEFPLHHHFFFLSPSACSYYYYNSQTTSGLLWSSFPFLSPSVTGTPTRRSSRCMKLTMSSTTTSFQPLFSSTNKAEGVEDCLLNHHHHHSLVKKAPLRATQSEYNSVTVPTTTTTTAPKLVSCCNCIVPEFFDCSLYKARIEVAR